MKIQYFTVSGFGAESYHSRNLSIFNSNFISAELAIEYIKSDVKIENEVSFDNLNRFKIYHEIEEEVNRAKESNRKNRAVTFYTEKIKRIVAKHDYTNYGYHKHQFVRDFSFGYSNEKADGYYISKLGDTEILINDEKSTVTFKAPVLVQFWSAKRHYRPEIKEVGKPYQSAGVEISEEKPISEWLPVYYNPLTSGYLSNTIIYFLDTKDRPNYSSCEQYYHTQDYYIHKQEIEVLES